MYKTWEEVQLMVMWFLKALENLEAAKQFQMYLFIL